MHRRGAQGQTRSDSDVTTHGRYGTRQHTGGRARCAQARVEGGCFAALTSNSVPHLQVDVRWPPRADDLGNEPNICNRVMYHKRFTLPTLIQTTNVIPKLKLLNRLLIYELLMSIKIEIP